MTNWNFLYTFVILAENLSFSETARILNTAQPVISRQIKILEEQFGTALFIRSKKRVELSSEGLALKLKLTPLVAEIRGILTAQKSPENLFRGKIRVGSVYEAGKVLLLPKISKFLNRWPENEMYLSLGSAPLILENIMKGSLDFGFVHRLSDRKSIRSFSVTVDTPVLIAEKTHAKSWRKDPVHRFVGYNEKDFYTQQFLSGNLSRQEQKKVRMMASVNSHEAIIQMVREHKMLAVIPQTSAQEALDRGHIEALLKDKSPHELYLVCHEQTLIDKGKLGFLNFLLKEFGSKEKV